MTNNLVDGLNVKRGRNKHRVVISNIDTGEVLYDNESYGGVVCSIEEITNKSLTDLEGVHQIGGFGSILEIFYGIDQLNKWFYEHAGEFVDQLFDQGVIISTPEVKESFKRSILERMNRTWKH